MFPTITDIEIRYYIFELLKVNNKNERKWPESRIKCYYTQAKNM